jgi:hypothetical protein
MLNSYCPGHIESNIAKRITVTHYSKRYLVHDAHWHTLEGGACVVIHVPVFLFRSFDFVLVW